MASPKPEPPVAMERDASARYNRSKQVGSLLRIDESALIMHSYET